MTDLTPRDKLERDEWVADGKWQRLVRAQKHVLDAAKEWWAATSPGVDFLDDDPDGKLYAAVEALIDAEEE